MAEGYGREFSDGRFGINSAGISSGVITDEAINAMIEDGIDITEHSSDEVAESSIKWADIIVTVSNSARDCCPSDDDDKVHIHWDIDNPVNEYHSVEDREAEFARVRDEIRDLVVELLEEI